MGPSSFKLQSERTEAIKTTTPQSNLYLLRTKSELRGTGRYTYLGAFAK